MLYLCNYQDTAGTSSGYAEGGGLYALGLIYANHGQDINEYLLGQVDLLRHTYINPEYHGNS